MAVEIVRRNGGVIDTAVVAQVQAALGKPVTSVSIRTWVKQNKENFVGEKKQQSDLPLQEVVARKLDEKLESAAHRFVDHATKDDIIDKMNGREAMTSAAIAIDKMRLLRDLPTVILGNALVLTELAEFLAERNQDFGEAQRQFLAMLREQDAKVKRA